MSWYGDIGSGISGGVNWLTGANVNNAQRSALANNATAASGFAQAGANNYNTANAGLGQANSFLTGQMQGQNSVAAEQLRQGLQQQLAQQQSMAAGASPQNAAMAARNAAQNMNAASYGMSGQAATAGLQERQNAAQQLGQNLLGQGNQAVSAATGGYGAVNNAYNGQIANPQKTAAQGLLSAGEGIAGIAMSDRRVKRDVEDGDDAARALREGLRAYTYKYKDPKHGAGKRIGIMAQDLERAGSKSVFQTREGKAVNGAVLATENTAMIVELGKRLASMEGKRAA